MKIIDKFALKVFSFIILLISLTLFMISVGLISEAIFGILISRLLTMINGGNAILIILSIFLFVLSIKSLFFTYSKKEQGFDDVNDEIENETGILLENDDGRVLITRRTIRSLINSVILKTDEVLDAQIVVDINAENEVDVKLAIDVIQGVVIKNVTSKLQADIKNIVAETTDINIKSVNIDVKECVDINLNDDTDDEIEEIGTKVKKSRE